MLYLSQDKVQSIKEQVKFLPIANFQTVPKKDIVIVIGGSPSVHKDIPEIIEYQQKHNALILTSNRYPPPPLKPNYLVVIDAKIYQRHARFYLKQPATLVLGNKVFNDIVSSSIIDKWNKWTYNTHLLKKPAKHKPNIPPIYRLNYSPRNSVPQKLKINYENGTVNQAFHGAGFASIIFAIFFQPRKVMLAGFDGPKYVGDKLALNHRNKVDFGHFSDPSSPPRIPYSRVVKSQTMLGKILSYYREKNIKILASGHNEMWHLDRERYRIQSIQ